MTMKMTVEKREDKRWWVKNMPPHTIEGRTYTSCGPYDTRADAVTAKVGLQKFYTQNEKELKRALTARKDGKGGSDQKDTGHILQLSFGWE